MNSADSYFDQPGPWKAELEKLRGIFTGFPLEEQLKWGAPVYTCQGNNLVGMHGFKEHFALWFYNGVFLKDPYKLLVSAADKTKSLRQIRLRSMDDLLAIENILPDYIREAIGVEQAGLKIAPDNNQEVEIPEEFQKVLGADPDMQKAFAALTPGRQKEYILHVKEARRSATRDKRVEKIVPMILAGVGLNDKYKR